MLEEAAGLAGPVVEVGAGAQQGDATDPGIVGGDADRERPARGVADEPHPVRIARLLEVVDGGAEVGDPAGQ